jgi:hypothetical protein
VADGDVVGTSHQSTVTSWCAFTTCNAAKGMCGAYSCSYFEQCGTSACVDMLLQPLASPISPVHIAIQATDISFAPLPLLPLLLLLLPGVQSS